MWHNLESKQLLHPIAHRTCNYSRRLVRPHAGDAGFRMACGLYHATAGRSPSSPSSSICELSASLCVCGCIHRLRQLAIVIPCTDAEKICVCSSMSEEDWGLSSDSAASTVDNTQSLAEARSKHGPHGSKVPCLEMSESKEHKAPLDANVKAGMMGMDMKPASEFQAKGRHQHVGGNCVGPNGTSSRPLNGWSPLPMAHRKKNHACSQVVASQLPRRC